MRPYLSLAAFLLVALLALPSADAAPYYVPARTWHGFDIVDYAVDPQSPILYILDSFHWLRAINMTDGGVDVMPGNFYDRDSWMYAVAAGPNNMLYARVQDSVLQISTQNWSITATFSLAKIQEYYWWRSSWLTVGSDNLLYFHTYNATSDQIWKLETTRGTVVDMWQPSGLPAPTSWWDRLYYDFALDRDNNVYLQTIENPDCTLYEYDSKGKVIRTIDMSSEFLDGWVGSISVARDGSIWLVSYWDSVELLPYTPAGKAMSPVSLLAEAYGVQRILWEADHALVLDWEGDAVLRFNFYGELVMSYSSDQALFSGSSEMQWDSTTSTLLVSSYRASHSVQRVDPWSGRLLQTYQLPERLSWRQVQGVTSDADGNIWLSFRTWIEWGDDEPIVVSMNKGGRIRRQVRLHSEGLSCRDLVVNSAIQRLYVACYSYYTGEGSVRGFNLQGDEVFNVSSPDGSYWSQDLVLGEQNSLYIVNWDSVRQVDGMSGALLSRYTAAADESIVGLAVQPGTGDLFVSHARGFVEHGRWNWVSLISRVRNGTVMEDYGGYIDIDSPYWDQVTVSDLNTMYAIDLYDNSLAMWFLQTNGTAARLSAPAGSPVQPIKPAAIQTLAG